MSTQPPARRRRRFRTVQPQRPLVGAAEADGVLQLHGPERRPGELSLREPHAPPPPRLNCPLKDNNFQLCQKLTAQTAIVEAASMSEIDEEALIAAVIRVRADLGIKRLRSASPLSRTNLPTSPCRCARKRARRRPSGPQASRRQQPSARSAAPGRLGRRPKSRSGRSSSWPVEVKAAEATMMEMQRRLRAAKLGDAAAAVTINESAERSYRRPRRRPSRGSWTKMTRRYWGAHRGRYHRAGVVKLPRLPVPSLKEDVRTRSRGEVGAAEGGARREGRHRCGRSTDAKPTRPAAAVDANAELDARVKAASLQPTAGALDEMD